MANTETNKNSSTQHEQFTNGQHVEVTSNDLGFKGAWYKATLLESQRLLKERKTSALVEYHNLLSPDGLKPLVEIVEFSFVRPLPPSHTENENIVFVENDVVDAFYNDGWWTGVVRRVFERDGTKKFWVYFDSPPDVAEFQLKELRPHYDWIHGKWVRADKRKNKSTGSHFSSGYAVEIRIDKDNLLDVWFPAIVSFKENHAKFIVMYKSSPNGGFLTTVVDRLHIRPVPPSSHGTDFDLMDNVEAACDSGWRSGVITKVLPERRYEVVFKLTREVKQVFHLDLRPGLQWIDGIWVAKSKDCIENQDRVEEKKNGANISDIDFRLGSPCTIRHISRQRTPRSSMKRSLMELPNDHNRSSSVALTRRARKAKLTAINSIFTTAQQFKKKRLNNGRASEFPRLPKTVSPRTRPLDILSEDSVNLSTTPNIGNAGEKRSRKSASGNKLSLQYEKPSNGNKDHMQDKHEAGKNGTTVTDKKRGRPPKSALKMTNSEGVSGNPDTLVLKAKVVTGSQPTRQEKDLDYSAVEKNVEARKQNGDKNSQKRKRGKPCKIDISSLTFQKSGLSNGKALDVCGTITNTREGKMDAAELSSNVAADDMPLYLLFEGMHSFTGRKKSKALAIEEHGETATRLEAGKQPQSADSTIDIMSNALPFVKSSPLWKTIESMEIYKSLAQKPHFRPLSECKEECREGNAIGMMVNFSSIAEKVPKLKFDDPRSTLYGVLESLLELEPHGFDVIALRSRVNDLLKLKDRELQIQDEIKDVEAKISQLTHEEKESGVEIDKTEKEIASLQQKLSQLKSKNENASVEIGRLRSHVNAINANFQLEIKKLSCST